MCKEIWIDLYEEALAEGADEETACQIAEKRLPEAFADLIDRRKASIDRATPKG